MVVNNLDFAGIPSTPAKYNSPLIIDSNRVKALSISLQGLEPVAWWGPKVPQLRRLVQILQFPSSRPMQVGRKRPGCFRPSVIEQIFGQRVPERFDHVSMLSEFDNLGNPTSNGSIHSVKP